MTTITITEGITLTATQSTINAYLIEKADAEAERLDREVEMKLRRWLADPANRHDECYSDIYKDVYGFRPRW
jgi:uncharacterized protein Yka (UPF0111/DUF47 family)